MKSPTRYSPEVRERAVRLVLDRQSEHDSQWSAITSVASKLGCTAETLRKWVRQAERDRGGRAGFTSEERRRLKELERENRELRRANEILRKASAYLSTFGRQHLHHSPRRNSTAARDDGVVHRRSSGSIRGRAGLRRGAEVPIAPSTYYEHKAREGEPKRAPSRVRRDGWLSGEIRRVYAEHFEVYGVRKVWRQLRREGVAVARCTVARRMRRMGLQGAVRGRRAKTTHSVVQGERPDDRVHREFKVSRPNAFLYVRRGRSTAAPLRRRHSAGDAEGKDGQLSIDIEKRCSLVRVAQAVRATAQSGDTCIGSSPIRYVRQPAILPWPLRTCNPEIVR